MSVRETLVRNTVWYGVVTVFGLAAGLAMSVVLARGLGPERMGDFSYLLWVTRTVGALATLGFALATVRYTADAFGRGRPGVALGFMRLFMRRQVITTLIVLALIVPVMMAFAPPSLLLPLLLMTAALVPITVENIYTNAIYGAQRYDVTARTSAIKMALDLVATVCALALGGGILGVAAASVLLSVTTCEIQRRQARRLYPATAELVPRGQRAEVRAYLLPLSVVAVLDALVWDRSEVFFLRLYTPSAEIGFYSLAFGLATRAMVLPEIVVGALLPALASLHGAGAHEEFATVYGTALRWVALVGAPIAMLVTALAPGLVLLLYGADYAPAAWILSVFAWVAVLGAMRKVAWAALRASGDRRATLVAMGVSAAINVVAAALLIPRYGTAGAVVANTLAQVVASLWGFVAVRRACRCPLPVNALLSIAGAAFIALAATLAMVGSEVDLVHLLAAGAAGMVVYVFVAGVAGELGPREWRAMAHGLRRITGRRAPLPPVETGDLDAAAEPVAPAGPRERGA